MFVDKARIYIKAGDGGDGCTSFYTEKYINNGGPDGGDGGKGGDVVFLADSRKASLIDFQFGQHFRAEPGERGTGKYCHGKGGKNVVIRVPVGTMIRDYETGGTIADLFTEGDTVTVLTGGSGGKGNARFKTSRRQAPHFAQCGQKCEEKSVLLELKTIADVGLVGYPNVGKSTLLSVISAARPKVANYHFTTLSPNLGVVKYFERSFVVADIPGLIEGASEGVGLGTEFLRHIDRTRLIVHVVDISQSEGRDAYSDYKNINKELNKYGQRVAELPQIVVLNKAELLQDDTSIKSFVKKAKVPVVVISAATRRGIDELIQTIAQALESLPPLQKSEFEPFEYVRPDSDRFEIGRDDDGAYEVFGGMIDELARNVILDNLDSFNYFQKRLKDEGVIKALRKAGAKDGDLVRIMDIEFDFVE